MNTRRTKRFEKKKKENCHRGVPPVFDPLKPVPSIEIIEDYMRRGTPSDNGRILQNTHGASTLEREDNVRFEDLTQPSTSQAVEESQNLGQTAISGDGGLQGDIGAAPVNQVIQQEPGPVMRRVLLVHKKAEKTQMAFQT